MNNQQYPLVKHTQFAPIHIIGQARSGTSITVALARKYLGIGIGTESQFIVRYFQKLNKYGDLNKDENLKLLIDDISKERYFKRCKKFNEFVVNPDQIYREVRERNYRGVLDAVFMQLSNHLNMKRWGDKTPEYIVHLPLIKQIFPDAQFIHVVRDGRDVALSTLEQPLMGANNIYMAARDWKESLLTVRKFAMQLKADQFIEIRYEDLLTNPSETLSKLIDFLKIDDSEGRLREFISKNIHHDLKVTNFNKWKSQFSSSQLETYERIASDMLQQHGYETSYKENAEFNIIKKVYWNIEHKCKKWLSPKYWMDNFYKAKLKLRIAVVPVKKVKKRTMPRS